MKNKQKANIAIECLSHTLEYRAVANISGLGINQVKTIEKRFREDAYRAFTPAMLDLAVSALAGPDAGLSVVQVGANDGVSGDPVNKLIHRYAAKALLIEPTPQLIDKLKMSYGNYDGELIIENAAIGTESGYFRLNMLDPSYWDEYIDKVGRHPTAISSNYQGPLVKKISTRLDVGQEEAQSRVTQIECPQYTLSTLFEKHALSRVDLLQVDCEGYDFEVITSLGEYRPRLINFESFNLDNKDWNHWKNWAKNNGYGWVQGRQDTLAILSANFASEF